MFVDLKFKMATTARQSFNKEPDREMKTRNLKKLKWALSR
jgi:hypothetical protein